MTPVTALDRVLAALPGVARDVAAVQLLATTVDFLADTGLWVVSLPPLDVVSGQSTYPLVSPVLGASVEDVQRVELSGVVLPRLVRADVVERTYVYGYEVSPARAIELHPTPTESKDRALYVVATLVPMGLDVVVPGLERWADVLVTGTLARIAIDMPHLAAARGVNALFLQRQYRAERTRAKVVHGAGWRTVERNALGGRV